MSPRRRPDQGNRGGATKQPGTYRDLALTPPHGPLHRPAGDPLLRLCIPRGHRGRRLADDTQRRLEAKGGTPGRGPEHRDLGGAAWHVGGRLYHVITSPQAFRLRQRRARIDAPVCTAVGIWGPSRSAPSAPGSAAGERACEWPFWPMPRLPASPLAEALGRGTLVQQRVYGSPPTCRGDLQIHEWDTPRRPSGHRRQRQCDRARHLPPRPFSMSRSGAYCWPSPCLAFDRRRQFAPGQLLGCFSWATRSSGSSWKMRTDPANVILGQRLNVWTSILVFLLGLALCHGRGPAGTDPATLEGGDLTY